jgi:phosphoenolpyruvate---glycerone phosphotransferase subunit DhaK
LHDFGAAREMAGCSITLARLEDDLLRLWDAPVHTAALRWGR